MNKIYVGNLPFTATEGSLESFISEFGFAVAEVKIVRDAHTGRSRGFGFVELGESVDRDEAISVLDGKSMEGRALKVDAARDKQSGGGGRPRSFDRRGGDGWN